MITIRRSDQRRHDGKREREGWLTFDPDNAMDPLAGGVGALEALNEDRVPPGGGLPPHPRPEAEIITYVREGTLVYGDSMGHSGVIQGGEFQCMAAARGLRRSETNPSPNDWAHVFQVRLRSSEGGLEPGHEQKRFSVAERRGGLCVVASRDCRRGSLRIHRDALIFSALLDPGQHVVHEILLGRSAWLHLVQGEVTLGDVVLTTGDGAGLTAERAVSITAREETEILLLDLGD